MKRLMIVPAVFVLMLSGWLAAPAQADECDKLTYLTFSAPVALPGVILPAGTYRFTHPDCSTTAGVLRVSSEDGTEVYGTFLTVPDERYTTSAEPAIVFAETRAHSPEAIRAFFYPGDTIGDELIYPRAQAPSLASATGHAALAAHGAA